MRLFALAIFLCLAGFASHAQAATLYLDPSSVTIGQGGSFTASVRLDTTAEECINAVDGVIQFDEGLEVSDVSVGSSIFSFWVESPTYDNEARTVTFAGGIPNGYCGRIPGDPQLTNTVADIIFRVPASESEDLSDSIQRTISVTDISKGYLNDGLGTAVALDTSGAVVTVTDEYAGGIDNDWQERIAADVESPKEFSITLTQNDSVFRGQYFIVFNTNDKQTGIDHYEVIEEPLDEINFFGWGAANAPWVRAVSPYQLEDQSLNSTIRVKAVDKAGNEYIATLVPDESVRGVNTNLIILYGLMLLSMTVLVVALWFGFHIWHVRRKEGEHEESVSEDDAPDLSENQDHNHNHYA